jgi:hypothetical protein
VASLRRPSGPRSRAASATKAGLSSRQQDEHAIHAGIGQARHQIADIAIVDADIGQPLVIHMAKRAGDAVHEGLGAQDQDVRMADGLGRHVLAATKPHLQPGLRRGRPKAGRVHRTLSRRAEGRQEGVQE